MSHNFTQYPLGREITREEYKKGHEKDKKEHARILREIRKFLAQQNIRLEEWHVGSGEWMCFRKPGCPDSLDAYIRLQEFIRSGTLILDTEK